MEDYSFSLRLNTLLWPSLEAETLDIQIVTFAHLLLQIGVHFSFNFVCWHLKKNKLPSCLPSFIPFLLQFVQYRIAIPDNDR